MDKFLKSKMKKDKQGKLNTQDEKIFEAIDSHSKERVNINRRFDMEFEKLETHFRNLILCGELIPYTKFEELFLDLKGALSNVETLSNSESLFKKIKELFTLLLKSFSVQIEEPIFLESVNEMIDFFEKCFYLLIFSSVEGIALYSFEVILPLLQTLDYSFHSEFILRSLEVLKQVVNRRMTNLLLCNRFIYYLAGGINLALHYSNDETRRMFLNNILMNMDNTMTCYLICGAVNSQYNFSKYYPNDILTTIAEKYCKEFEKHLGILEGLVTEISKQSTQIIRNKLKQTTNNISCAGRIIFAFLIRGNKTYSYSKIIFKLNTMTKNFWDLLLVCDTKVCLY